MGDLSFHALHQIRKEFTNNIDLESASASSRTPNNRESVIQSFVYIHQTLKQVNIKLQKKGSCIVFITSRHYINLIDHFIKLYHEKRAGLEEEQLHLNEGLDRIKETMDDVEELQKTNDYKDQQVTNQLENVEPAVIETLQTVRGIRRQDLVIIRNLPNLPPLVKLALEAICLLFDQETTD